VVIGRFISGEIASVIDWISSGLGVGVDEKEKRIFLIVPGLNYDPFFGQSVASRYTD
jgi:hypothetical protein